MNNVWDGEPPQLPEIKDPRPPEVIKLLEAIGYRIRACWLDEAWQVYIDSGVMVVNFAWNMYMWKKDVMGSDIPSHLRRMSWKLDNEVTFKWYYFHPKGKKSIEPGNTELWKPWSGSVSDQLEDAYQKWLNSKNQK